VHRRVLLLCTSVCAAALLAPAAASANLRGARLRIRPDHATAPSGARATSATTEYSTNWSGYVAQSAKKFKTVSTTYVQPAVTCTKNEALAAFWDGLDGYEERSETVEQDGTLAYCNGKTPEYAAWWEMYPTNDVQPTFDVAPGNTITASVTFAQRNFTMTVRDVTTGASYTSVQRCGKGSKCLRSSAEWIVERPSYETGLAYLPDWGTLTLGSDSASTSKKVLAISSFTNTALDMVNEAGTKLLATVGPLGSGGSSFSDTWDAAE